MGDPPPGEHGPVEAGESDERVLVVFTVANAVLAVPALQVDMVTDAESPTPVPGAPPHVLGVVPAGESVLPLLDLASLLGLSQADGEATDRLFRRTLIVRSGEYEAGLVCQRTRGLYTVQASEMGEPSVLRGARLQPFLAAEIELGDAVVGILDLHALLEAAAIP